jgi:uncharacterized membrane protein
MKALFKPFFSGLLFAVPIGATLLVLIWAFEKLDALLDVEAWLGWKIPGLGILVLFLVVSALGIISRVFLARWLAERIGSLFHRLPGVKLVYDSIKDLIEALLGDKKMFDSPVLVTLESPIGGDLLGFVTSEDLNWLGLPGSVSVYLPQSFGWAGQMILIPKERVRPLDVEASQVTQFLVSGGISRGGGDDAPSARA